MSASSWEIHPLKLRPDLVWDMALSSMRVRLGRTLLTLATITAASAFIMFLLFVPLTSDPAGREAWLLMLALSLFVSVAGVLNTMLMSITQRYREIGTIKCLGALDSFVLLSVLVEAAMLGLVGGCVGVVLGAIAALLLGLLEHGTQVLEALRLGGWWWKVAASLGVGVGLTTLGAIIPALLAARMPPIEAMRGEK